MQTEEQIRRTTRAIRRLYTREKQWLESRTNEQLSLLTQEGELQLSEQMHYGEVAFLILGLKPCVLIDYAGDRTQLADYISSVIQPSLRELNDVGRQSKHLPITNTSGAYPRQFSLVCKRIDGDLGSPEVPNWTGAYALYDAVWEESEMWTREHLLDPERKFISENDLAKGLDYPGSLPSSVQDARSIVPVSYLGRMKSESGEWMCDRWECLTSFIVLHHQLPQVAHHRMRYQAIRMFDIEMHVNIDTEYVNEFQM